MAQTSIAGVAGTFSRTFAPYSATILHLTPLPVTVSGIVTLEGAVNKAQSVTFTFRPTTGAPSFSRTVTLSGTGAFSLSAIPAGTFNLAVKGAKWLRVVSPLNASTSVNNIGMTLLAGDATNDNIVDVEDLAILIAAFDANSSSPNWNGGAGDLNCDDIVSVDDLDLIIRNFDAEGDA